MQLYHALRRSFVLWLTACAHLEQEHSRGSEADGTGSGGGGLHNG